MLSFNESYLMATSAIYNFAIILVAWKLIKSIDLKRALSEKPSNSVIASLANATAAGAAQGATAAAQAGNPASPELTQRAAAGATTAAIEALQPDSDQLGDSYSRITGLIGTLVLVCFIWAVGNVVLYNAFTAPGSVKQVLDGVGPFILSGAALFAPYAFNKLSQVFTQRAA